MLSALSPKRTPATQDATLNACNSDWRSVPTLIELHHQLTVEMAIAGCASRDVLAAVADVFGRELAHLGESECVRFVALWVRMLREENRCRGCEA